MVTSGIYVYVLCGYPQNINKNIPVSQYDELLVLHVLKLFCGVFLFSVLMKEPLLQDKRTEFLKFCKYANELIERVSGKPPNPNADASLERIRKVGRVVA